MAIIETRVAAAGDDVEQKASGSISTNVTDLELGYDGNTSQTVGIRFTGIDIPQGAIITSAYIQFQTNEAKTGATSLLIKGEDADDASAFTSVKFNVSSRATTDASAAWAPDPWTTVGDHGLAERTPDLTAIVQEIVSRSGWVALNDMAFLITGTGTRTADSYEYNPASAPLLHIEYILPSAPVAFNTPADADPVANQITELAAAGAPIGITASATDPDAGSTVTYSLNDARFAIDADTGVITRSANGTLDFETQPSINLTVTATSSDGSTANQSFTLAVLDNPEPVAFNAQPDTDTALNRIAQNAAAGTAIGVTASATDPDASSTVTYSIDDARFAIDPQTGVITRSGTGTLDATTEPSVNFNVTATSSDGSTDTHAFSVGVTGTTPVIIETRVAAAGDDVEQKASGAISTNVTDLELGYDGTTSQTVGLRFTGIDIPQGAIITSAYIQFQTNEVKTGTTSLLIKGEDADDASAFTSVKFNVSSRATTDASAAWAPDPWTTVGDHGLTERTPDLTAIVQEIVDRSGWAALNDMAFLITGTGTRTADSYEYSPSSAPLLHIEYILPGPVSAPVAFDTPPDADATANQITELAAAGAPIGITASATDPDAGSTVTYSLNDERFAIDASSGVVTRSANGTLDFETQSSINLTVAATSSDGSTTSHSFTVAVLDSPEPVAFNASRDADTAVNQISQNAAAGTTIGITASATDPDANSTVTYSIDDARFAINASTGVITRSGSGTLNAQSEPLVSFNVTATSSDGSTDTHAFAVDVTGGSQLPTSVTLAHTILTSQWSPPSPDPTDIVYISHLGTLLVADSEVDEMSIFTGKNLYQMSLSGSLVGTLTTINFSDEPSGVAYNPVNRHLFFTDDTGTRSVYELNPGQDGLYNTSDDIVTSFKTSAFGSTDPEGISYDTNRGVLYVADGTNQRIYTVAPGANGIFDGVASTGGDDIVTSFSAQSLGTPSDESIAYDPVHDILYIIQSRDSVAMVTPTGQLLGTLDISAADAHKPAGLALAPSSDDSSQTSLYIVDRGTDNDSNPNENDGKIYEFSFDHWMLV
ncbi:putative Ig domain-containing protein [Mesorhizobium sp. IMUNJ 23033]|uniref:putative Ig domain-containing protein n=1 Tax=Mesorhizobium sp. IMUNJ 23033 TaxID=3378039 RepID=UPI003850E74B